MLTSPGTAMSRSVYGPLILAAMWISVAARLDIRRSLRLSGSVCFRGEQEVALAEKVGIGRGLSDCARRSCAARGLYLVEAMRESRDEIKR